MLNVWLFKNKDTENNENVNLKITVLLKLNRI